MALTLAEAAKLTRNMLVRGVVEQIITESPILNYLPFITVRGSGIDYNRESTIGTADSYAVGDTWTEDTPTFTKITVALKIMGGDADVDEFIQQTYSSENDIRAEVISAKSKAVGYRFNDLFYNGDATTSPKTFDGLKIMAGAINTAMAYSGNVRAATNGANGFVLNLDDLDTFVDAVKPGNPEVLLMSKRSRRKLNSIKRASGSGVLETSATSFGRRVRTYNDVPVEVDENILDTEAQGTSGAVCSSIYAVKFGFKTGLMGLQNGGIQVRAIGNLETKDAWRTRIKWYNSLALFRTWSLARLAGVKIA